MKKITVIFLIFSMLFSFASCSASKTTNNKMYIQAYNLTKEEQSILDIVGSEKKPYIFNYYVDDTVKSLQLNVYELQENKWKRVAGGGSTTINEMQNRIAIAFDKIGLGLRTTLNSTSAVYDIDKNFNFDGLNTTATSVLTEKTTIEYDKEIPLVVQIHTSKNEIPTPRPDIVFNDPQKYADLGCEKVYVVTCSFSQKTLNEAVSLSGD